MAPHPHTGQYEHYKTLEEKDTQGRVVRAIINRRKSKISDRFYYSFTIQRDYTDMHDEGKSKKTSWMGADHLEAVGRLIHQIESLFYTLDPSVTSR